MGDVDPNVDYIGKIIHATNKYEAPIPYRVAKLASMFSDSTEGKLSDSFLSSSEKWRTKQRRD